MKKKRSPTYIAKYGYKKINLKSNLTGKDKTIRILERAKEQWLKRQEYNAPLIKKVISKKRQQLLKDPVKRQISEIDKAIERIKTSKIRPRTKALAMFEDLMKVRAKEDSGFEDLGILVNDRLTNFKVMILRKLQKEGVDIYNPSEMSKIFGTYTIEEMLDEGFFNRDDGENWYDVMDAKGAEKSIKSIVGKAKKQAKEQAKHLKIAKNLKIKKRSKIRKLKRKGR